MKCEARERASDSSAASPLRSLVAAAATHVATHVCHSPSPLVPLPLCVLAAATPADLLLAAVVSQALRVSRPMHRRLDSSSLAQQQQQTRRRTHSSRTRTHTYKMAEDRWVAPPVPLALAPASDASAPAASKH